jgi:hypothetical protein
MESHPSRSIGQFKQESFGVERYRGGGPGTLERVRRAAAMRGSEIVKSEENVRKEL